MRKQVFTSEAAAQAAYDADPAAHSMTGYPAGPGYEASYTVYFDDEGEHEVAQGSKVLTVAELFEPLERAHEKEVQTARGEYEKELLSMGVATVSQEIAAEKGLSGVEKEMFLAGFCSVPAYVANPRKHGLETIFRDGRVERRAKGVEQRCRAAAAALRKSCKFIEPSLRGFGYPAMMKGEG